MCVCVDKNANSKSVFHMDQMELQYLINERGIWERERVPMRRNGRCVVLLCNGNRVLISVYICI